MFDTTSDRCSLESILQTVYRYFNDALLGDADNLHQRGQSLVVSPVRVHDYGRYTCVTSLTHSGKEVKATASLSPPPPPPCHNGKYYHHYHVIMVSNITVIML